MLVGGIGEFLADDTGAVACEEGRYGLLRLFRVFDIFQRVVLVAVGTVVGE